MPGLHAAREVKMIVDESRDYRRALDVDNLGLRSGIACHLGVGAARDDPTAIDCERLDHGEGRVHRQDLAVRDDRVDVGLRERLPGRCEQREPEAGELRSFHFRFVLPRCRRASCADRETPESRRALYWRESQLGGDAMRMSFVIASFVAALATTLPFAVIAQPPASAAAARAAERPGERPRVARPPLFVKEDWKQIPGGGEHPVTPASVTVTNVELKLYGASSKESQLTGADGDENNPTHVWTGLCTTPCGLALRDKTRYVDLTGLARIRWNVKTSGFHEIRPIVKLADGTWLVGDHTPASSLDRPVGAQSTASVRLLKLDT